MKIIGHRGARGLAPENTIAGLQKAVEHGVDEVEFDLRVTKDSVVILHHDAELADPNGDKHVIANHTYAELKDRKKDLATLEEALEAMGKEAVLYIEVKRGEVVKPIVSTIISYLSRGWQAKQMRIGSKSQKTLLELHSALPDIQKIVIEPWSGLRATRRARQVDTRLISMNQRWLWWGFIRLITGHGWQLYTYTLNDPAKAKRWARAGLYAVVTDYPDRF